MMMDCRQGTRHVKTIRSLVLVAAVCASFPAAAQDLPVDDRWYIAPALGFVSLDRDRATDRKEPVYGLSFGRFFTPNFSLDFRLDRYSSEIKTVPAGVDDDFDLFSYGLVGRYYMGDSERFSPYAFLGAGIQEHDSWLDDGRDVFGGIGLGMEHAFNDRVSSRVEVEYRYDNDRETIDRSSGFKDVLFTLGMKIHLGERPQPPAPEPQRAPEPAPRPAPQPEPEPEPEPEIVFEFSAEVLFPLDSAELRPAAKAELNEASALLKLHQELERVEVAGHTCDLGPESYNQGLSQRRAQAVRDYLVSEGVDADRLNARGYGESRPAVSNSSEENRRHNRRVELIVIERSDG